MKKEYGKIIYAYSLAEVLLALTIVGVIASYTIPTLLQNVQDASLKIAWKSTYSMLEQVSKKVLMDNAGSMLGIFDDDNTMRDKFAPYFVYTKSCDRNQHFGVCWHDIASFWMYNGALSDGDNWGPGGAGLILNNGVLLNIKYNTSDCSTVVGGLSRCGWIGADVNGFKGPNVVGRDIFVVHILKDQIKPYGAYTDMVWNSCRDGQEGFDCAAKYLLNK